VKVIKQSNIAKGPAIKGSKYWMQRVVNEPEMMRCLNSMIGQELIWLSPLAGPLNTYDEYQLSDKCVCQSIGLDPKAALELFGFWPKRQPQWDALALDASGTTLYLVEAKAHLSEMECSCSAKNPDSIDLITRSMHEVQSKYYGKCADFERYWMRTYYQLGNRLTFLRKLSEQPFGRINHVKLVLLNFANDTSYIPTTGQEWQEHYEKVWDVMIGEKTAPKDVIVIDYPVA